MTILGTIPPPHEHAWEDFTHMGDAHKQEICHGCGALRWEVIELAATRVAGVVESEGSKGQ